MLSSLRTGLSAAAIVGCGVWGITSGSIAADETTTSRVDRVTAGLEVLYDFASTEGADIADRSGAKAPIPLTIADTQAVRRKPGELEVVAATLMQSSAPADRLVQAVQKSGALTLEAWIRPATMQQSGPARIVTLSANPSERNLTLGQNGDRCEVRLRTSATSTNGMPATSSKPKSLTQAWTHLVYTRSSSGSAKLYVDGRLNSEQKVGGNLQNWASGYRFALANEITGDRPWLGSYRLVAIYSRDLPASEVHQNFRAGGGAGGADETLAVVDPQQRFFELQVAPLLSRRCLECHDAASREGGLDLSMKTAALEGGKGGRVIVPGRPEESQLWKLVSTDKMPHDREPLSAEEKQVLQQWLRAGANWSLDVIDPAVYSQGAGGPKVYVQRLTVPEYIETVRSVLGVDISGEAREILPVDLRADGFSNTAYNLNVDLEHVEAYARLAELIVQRIDLTALARRHTNSRELTDENVTKVIEPVGQALFRGKLSKEELTRFCGVSTSVAAAGGDFSEALAYICEAMLQSPRLLYRIEDQRSGEPLDPFETAARLSYIVWGGPPDAELLKAAEDGTLDRAGIERQLARLLQDRRAVERSRQFIAEWLHLDQLDDLRPDPQRFPDWDRQLAADMRSETLRFFEELAWRQQRPLTDLLNAQETWLTPRLARHYGLPGEPGEQDDALARYDLSQSPGYGGLLTQGALLTIGGDDASMVTRGLFVLHELLRGVVRDPPPCVDTTPPKTQPGQSQRTIAEVRLRNANCAGCHGRFEPLAFGLERFDGLGTYREMDEHGNALREDGNLLIPGEAAPRSFQHSDELMNLLSGSERVRETFTWKLAQFCVGRPLGAEDAAALAEVNRRAWKAGGTYADLLTAIVMSDLVQQRRIESSDLQ